MTSSILPVFGVDVGGVLIRRCDDDADTSFFGANYLTTPEVEGAFASLMRLHDNGVIVHLVSKCGASTQEKTLAWLEHHDFYKRTGTAKGNVHFCRQRKQKAAICAEIKASHFVDDRLEILSYLGRVPNRYLLNSVPEEVMRFSAALNTVTPVENWIELATMVEASIGLVQESECIPPEHCQSARHHCR